MRRFQASSKGQTGSGGNKSKVESLMEFTGLPKPACVRAMRTNGGKLQEAADSLLRQISVDKDDTQVDDDRSTIHPSTTSSLRRSARVQQFKRRDNCPFDRGNNIIRLATPEDLQSIVEVEQSSFPNDPHTSELLRHEMTCKHWCVFVMEVLILPQQTRQIVGYLFIRIMEESVDEMLHPDLPQLQYEEERAGEYLISNFAIAPGFRGYGLGRQLLVFAMQTVGQEKRITLTVRRSNLNAISLYKSVGFTCLKLIPDYYDVPCEAARLMLARGMGPTTLPLRLLEALHYLQLLNTGSEQYAKLISVNMAKHTRRSIEPHRYLYRQIWDERNGQSFCATPYPLSASVALDSVHVFLSTNFSWIYIDATLDVNLIVASLQMTLRYISKPENVAAESTRGKGMQISAASVMFPMWHEHVLFHQLGITWVCDLCNVPHDAQVSRWRCQTCDYDLCVQCVCTALKAP